MIRKQFDGQAVVFLIKKEKKNDMLKCINVAYIFINKSKSNNIQCS